MLVVRAPFDGATHQSLLSQELVHNGGFSNFELLLLVRNATSLVQSLCGLIYKACSTFITKFGAIELFLLVLD